VGTTWGAYGKNVLTEYTERFPASRIFLAWWREGGQVLGDILAGGGGGKIVMPIVDFVLPPAKSLPIAIALDEPDAKRSIYCRIKLILTRGMLIDKKPR
jgi:hypothetical protein